jgi:radical S-adenosyl methionine domain-containing protein 2
MLVSVLYPTPVTLPARRGRCNYACKFCFHTAKTSDMAELSEAFDALRRLRQAGARKINFAGGEPFLYPDHLGAMVAFCKRELKFESVSIITNASRLTREWFDRYGADLDVLGVSCDSFVHKTNVGIGRDDGKRGTDHVGNIYRARDLARAAGCRFKVNTVVCALNAGEDMNARIADLAPDRWKVFQASAGAQGAGGGGGWHPTARSRACKHGHASLSPRPSS